MNSYMVSDATYTEDGKISNKHRHSKWFVNKLVSKGERVALHTKVGQDKERKNGDVLWHHIYWNFKTPIWNDDGDAAVLVEISNWKTTKAR
ncbi:hypothetical protein QMK50_06605 [Pseudomonas sp. P5_152]|uniref:hypothetical protein n=1 Tax=unclassified Pseudomonas TaxID=196821 RepID=UPI001359434B|nr:MULTISPECIES: hypothetical protein [unclassified Pseudomonas]MDX9664638.1 hypothetical protein [Pseudomonas sp. P5_152]